MPRLTRKRNPLALVLGGGGALGAAHVGVLKVLRERGIRPDLVVGTSAGAIVGAAYASGMSIERIEHLVLAATWSDVGHVTLTPGVGLLDIATLHATIDRLAGPGLLIEDLPIRFAAVATDLNTREPVIIDRGPLAQAVCASAAVPGIFKPSLVGGRLLVDGGVVQNLPIESAFALGAKRVIAVRLAPEWDALPALRTATRVHEFEIMREVTVITPRLGARSQWAPQDLGTMLELGEQAARTALSQETEATERGWDWALRLGQGLARWLRR